MHKTLCSLKDQSVGSIVTNSQKNLTNDRSLTQQPSLMRGKRIPTEIQTAAYSHRLEADTPNFYVIQNYYCKISYSNTLAPAASTRISPYDSPKSNMYIDRFPIATIITYY